MAVSYTQDVYKRQDIGKREFFVILNQVDTLLALKEAIFIAEKLPQDHVAGLGDPLHAGADVHRASARTGHLRAGSAADCGGDLVPGDHESAHVDPVDHREALREGLRAAR